MPLPSVEAPTPEAAVAAARERYGHSVRITGVRRIRSGGVLGFFATERFVAEVEEVEPARRTPAPKSESARRIEAALSRDAGVLADSDIRPLSGARRPATTRPAARPARQVAELPDPVDELAGLLGGGDRPEVDLYSRAAFPAAGRRTATAARPAAHTGAAAHSGAASRSGRGTADRGDGVADALAPAGRPAGAGRPATSAARRPNRPAARPPATPPAEAAGPSLFTAALAQVVAGDREVREAVDDAVATALRTAPEPVQEEPAARSVVRPPAAAPAAPAVPFAAALAAVTAAAPAPAPAAAPAPEPVPAPVPVTEVPAPAVAPVVEPAPVVEVPAPAPAPVTEPATAATPEVDMWADMWADPAPAVRPAVLARPAPVAPAAAEEPVGDEQAEVAGEESLLAELLGDAEEDDAPAEVTAPAAPAHRTTELAVVDDEPVTDVLPAVVVAPIEVPAPQPVVPAWAPGELDSGPATGREEAIAEVLRAALAHDTPDDALTDILRGVLASASTEGGVHRGRPPVPARARVVAEEPAWVEASAESDEWEVAEQVGSERLALAATASDPAPVALDSTAVLPPLSLLPPPTPGKALAVPPLLSRPPVPPARRRPPVPGAAVARVAAPRPPSGLATVTRLPVETRTGGRVVVPSVRERGPSGRDLADTRMVEAAGTVARLRALGVPEELLDAGFTAEVAAHGTYAALTRALGAALPAAPSAPAGPGEVLLVVGPGVETLAAARALSVSMRLDADRLQWATRGDLAALAAEGSRITSVDTALTRKQESAAAATPTVVAVDAPMRAGGRTWLEQVMAVFSPVAVWAVVEATRKPEDVGPWLDALPRVDALVVQDTDLTADPAAVLGRTTVPVALLDGVRATAHRWASLLCERLETAEA
ncbi:hypothetical protein SAMN05660464_2631 [Geodermatophilus dictyosporus]|uniref:Meckel syndrome type 1 protein n=1 Tax=Geodermatophilus dictyosporus TaxID=1523247 RepID=A0A1I5NPQ0_9ACTN|nr:hypothetical protein [Geodermatophilus dictyosporus]SFP23712.1 hypothetical protein SAMN05660464_2631 [Geodermatophilus dictyosporus]